jgi:hypothetical protein
VSLAPWSSPAKPKNIDAERKAAEVRIRAERRAGQLLKEVERTPGKRTDLTSSPDGSRLPQVKEQAKISDKQAENWQKLAVITA